MFESFKDPNTGQIKKPILFSLIGGAGLFAYLMFFSKNSGASSVDQSSTLTPELPVLQDALSGLTSSNGGASGSSPSLDPPPGFGTVTQPTYSDPSPVYSSPTPSSVIDSGDMPIVNVNPYVDQPGDNGNAGGGGGGTTTLLTPIAKSPDVYGGISVPLIGISIPTPIKPKAKPTPKPTGPSRIYEPIAKPISGGGTWDTPRIAKPTSGGGTWGGKSGGGTWGGKSGGGTWGTPKPKVKVVTPTPLRTRTSPVAI